MQKASRLGYPQLCVDGWAAEVAKRYGAETMAEIEWTAWNDQVASDRERMKNEFLPTDAVAMIQTDGLPTKTAPMLAAHPCGWLSRLSRPWPWPGPGRCRR
jgi:hypothetical protein